MAVIPSTTLTLTLPDVLEGVTAQVMAWSERVGATPAECRIEFPTTTPDNQAWTDLRVILTKGNDVVFRGRSVESHYVYGGQQQNVSMVCADVRWEMAARQVGQYGIGPTVTSGGWPGIGYDLVFNPGGRPNRSTVATNGVYTFSTATDADYWTYADIIQFLYYWYVPAAICTVDAGQLTGPFLRTAGEITASVGTVTAAIDRICRDLSGTWTVIHTDANTSTFRPVMQEITPADTRPLRLNGISAADIIQDTYSVSQVSVHRSIRNAYDDIQIHSAPRQMEFTYASTFIGLVDVSAPTALLSRYTTAAELPPGAVCWFEPDTNAYASCNLGLDLADDALPKPWLSTLCTRRASTGYLAAGASLANGDAIPARECVWISTDNAVTWYRVKSGITIDPDRARVYVQNKVGIYGSTKTASPRTRSITDVSQVHLAITVATRLELPFVSGTTSTSIETPRVRRIVRRDLVPQSRYFAVLPDLDSANPNDRTIAAESAVETYNNPLPTMNALRNAYIEQREFPEYQISCTCPFAPVLHIGDAATFSPNTFGLPTLRIADIQVNAMTLDYTLTLASTISRV